MIPGISNNKYKHTYEICKTCDFFARDICLIHDMPTRPHFTCDSYEPKEEIKDDKKKD